MTINNLIGYDPLGWMSADVVEESAITEPVKKVTRAKAKVASVEIIEEVNAVEAAEIEIIEEILEELSADSEDEVENIEPLVDLGAHPSLKSLSTLYTTFKRVIDEHDVIEINASEIATIDTATLQLLVSLKKDASRLNKTITIIYPSERFIESAKLLDLLTILDVTE
ncbi:hypothetical protein LBMAG43_12970 [Methylococcaceae bacterium]|nr:hypothetical protein LBMAG43_12970 [Methylococcaceae bacterium]